MKESDELLQRMAGELLSVRHTNQLTSIFNTTLRSALAYTEAAIFSLDSHSKQLRNLIRTNNPSGKPPFFLDEVGLNELSIEEILLADIKEDFLESRKHDEWQMSGLGKYLAKAPPEGSHMLIFPMRDGNDFIGNLFLLFVEPDAFEGTNGGLLRLLSLSINLVLIHALAREQVSAPPSYIRERVTQMEMLVSLGTSIASARSFEKLQEAIEKHLSDFIGFRQTVITALDKGRLAAVPFPLDSRGMLRVLTDGNAINDGYIEKVLLSEEPLIFNLEKMAARRPLPNYLKNNYEDGSKQVVMTRLGKASDISGVWILTFDHSQAISQNTLQIVSEVAKQLSIAVQNIIVNREYERREQERNRLMQFSNVIASIKDKAKLGRTIKEHLRELFGIDDFILWSLSKDHLHRFPVLFDDGTFFARHPGFKTALTAGFRNDDGIYNIILGGNGVSYFNSVDLETAYSDHPYFAEVIETSRLTAMGGSLLRIGAEVIGLLTFSSHHIHLVKEREALYLTICSQLAIVASNMFATDKISEQLAEISGFKERLEDEKIYLQEELKTSVNNSDMIGSSTGMKAVHKLIEQVAYTDSTVLILGETGTGKELVAQSVHNNSPRKSKLMVKVNCAALPASLIESELFGHEKGSFTGASERRLGKFELANHGTLFLDEIGELPLDLQGKLLRALQEKEIERVGGKTVIKVDVRVIAATNRNLEKEVAAGKFRSDLYYRINIFPIRLPSLRDRLPDIPLLASHFISKYAAKFGKDIKSLNTSALRELQRYNWPGNVREMEHTIERSVLLTKGDTLKTVDIPTADSDMHDESMYLEKKIKTIDENERDHIVRTLQMCRGRINGHNGAAILLGIPPSTLNSKMKRLDIRKREMRP